ncbi:hypothetical protein J1C56_02465 [Aminobacter anthyllidis]|uniref:Uncharacterized protein n=1 Tax=Aminobacter anthyllidis TaxID=1035067 RepID=A0A9X1A706_9HYPH|nr:hypothetical protein [Aminobacter anthyllidis]MBT1154448.1 hypothetical protein [Aminobacter anthyllidis]
MPKEIKGELWWSDVEINDYLDNPKNAIAHVDDPADVMATLGEQLRTDHLVEDGFREALTNDTFLFDEFEEGDYHETLDLCDIVEAVGKGHILYV